MSSNKNSISLETLNNNAKKFTVVGYVVAGFMAIAIGATLISNGGASAAVGVAVIAGGAYFMKVAYDMLVDPRNERKCDLRTLDRFSNMEIPAKYLNGDFEVDTVLDTSEYDILMKVLYNGYGGVFLKSNVANDSIGGNYDAWFIPGNAKSVLSQRLSGSGPNVAQRLYVVNKGDNRVTVKSSNNSLMVGNDRPRISPLPSSPLPWVSECDPTS